MKNKIHSLARAAFVALMVAFVIPAFATPCDGSVQPLPAHCPQPTTTPATSPVTATGTGTATSGARAGAAANAGATSGSVATTGPVQATGTGGAGGQGGQGGAAGAVAATGPVIATGGPSQAAAAGGDSSGQKTSFDSYSKTFALALAYSAAPHERDSGSMAAPAVGVVTPSACMPDYEGEGANRKVKRDPIDYPEGTIIEVTNPDGTKRILEGIVREEVIVGKRKLSGFGADTKSRAKSETRAGGVLLAHVQGGDSDSEAVGTTGFKSEYQPCPYRVNYYRAKTQPAQPAATGAADSSVKVGVAQTKVAERKAWACWFGDPAKKPAKAKNGAPVRQCNMPSGLVEGERVKLLHGDTVTTLESAEGSAGASVSVEAAAKK